MTHTNTSFRPLFWLRHRHTQTLWPSLCRRPAVFPRTRQRLTTPDGDFLDLDWHGNPQGPLALLLHGLTGSSHSGYILGLQHRLARQGFLTVALNFRGCSGQSNHTARCYHSGDTEDIDFVYHWLRQQFPARTISVAGFSLGGNALLKWLGQHQPGVTGAVAVSVPFLLNRCADRMDQGFSRIYRQRLLDDLRSYLCAKQRHLTAIGAEKELARLKTIGDLSQVRSFWEFDTRVIAHLYGFRDAADYYRQSSSRQFLRHITSPTLILHARDDPFVPPDAIPENNELSTSVQLQVTRHGGHVGFVTGNRLGLPDYWLDERISAFLLARLNHNGLE